MKKDAKKRYFAGLAHLVTTGEYPKGRKDGSVATHPVVPCEDVLEGEVLKACEHWLRVRRVVCDRNNVGMGDIGNTGGVRHYGIKGGGDIMGLLPNGIHYEVECKRGKGGSLSKVQQERRDMIQGSGGYYFIVHGVPELELFMEKLI